MEEILDGSVVLEVIGKSRLSIVMTDSGYHITQHVQDPHCRTSMTFRHSGVRRDELVSKICSLLNPSSGFAEIIESFTNQVYPIRG